MDQHDFLSAVLPSAGKYCVAVIHGTTRKHIFVDDLDNLYNTSLTHSGNGKNTFLALGAFDTSGKRKVENATALHSVFMDLDCGVNDKGVAKSFPSKRDAVVALHKWLEDTGLDALGEPWLVDSGGGVHVYWPLADDAPVAAWLPVAEGMKRLAHKHHFPIDLTVTADAARVMRMPGTFNYKYDPPKPVRLVKQGGAFALAALQTVIDANGVVAHTMPTRSTALALPGTAPQGAMSATAIALAGNTTTLFKNIVQRTAAGTGCAQVAHYFANAAQDGMEPLWRGMLSLSMVCADSARANVLVSNAHPYDAGRMHQKLAEIKGPYSCAKLDGNNPSICEQCPHWGKITNPLALGRAALVTSEPTQIELPPEDEDDAPSHITRPKPPFGFSFGQRGGVFYRKLADKKGEEDKDVMVLPYDFFLLDVQRDGDTYTARFTALKGASKIIVAVPVRCTASKDDTVKTLAGQNIIASYGAGNDVNIYHYVRSCIAEASVSEKVASVPPNMGWQETGDFVVGDTVYSQQGPEHNYTFVAPRLDNLIDITRPQGTLESWQQVMHMLRRKKQWGLLAVAGIGFGSVLKRFMRPGSRCGTFHIASGDTGLGKTFALKLCASIWGNPEAYMVNPTTSSRTMMQRAGLLGSLPLIIDEVTNAAREGDKEWVPRQVFDYSQGAHKIKGSAHANAEVRDDLRWDATQLMSSNAPMMEFLLAVRKTTSSGEVRRLLEWRPSVKLDWTEEEAAVTLQFTDNYGVAGRRFAQWLVLNQDTAQRVCDMAVAQWRTLVKAEDSERFWTSDCAAIMAGYVLAGPQYANVLEMPVTEIMNFLKSLVLDARRIINTNRTFAIDVLNDYVREHHGQFVKLQGDSVMAKLHNGAEIRPDSARSAIRGRVEYEVVPGFIDFYVEIRMLKAHCADMNRSYIDFVKELQGIAVLSEVRKDLLANTKGPSLRVKALKISRPVAPDDDSQNPEV